MSALFSQNFLDDHVGQIKTDPKIAVIELIANSSDAGSTDVTVKWPSENDKIFSVTDNGVGMTKDEFLNRWSTLCFDRRKVIGKEVIFPAEVNPKPHRSLFGKSGKGRHAAFCFAEEYLVETTKDGFKTKAKVKQMSSLTEPFSVDILECVPATGHGTIIIADTQKMVPSEADIIDVIGSKFLLDPSFNIFVNDHKVALTSIEGTKTDSIFLSNGKEIEIITIDSEGSEKTNRLRGVAFWVNNRLVGTPSWKSTVGGSDYLDGRSGPAKRYAFVVRADILDQQVKEDWSTFKTGDLTTEVFQKVDAFVKESITELLSETRRERKIEVLQENKRIIAELPPSSRLMVGQFLEQVQSNCPSMKQDDMANAVQVFAKLEQARSGYDLLKQLAACSPEDLSRWNDIISKWDARQAQVILDEIEKRIRLVSEMRRLVHEKTTDELHELQPLFEQGLWIFGPQYETVEYVANKQLKTIVEKFFKSSSEKLEAKRDRPDIITSPVGVWDSSLYDAEGSVVGSERVLILELKRGGFHVTQAEVDQARDYALELRKAGAIQTVTTIDCIVMGSTIEPFVSPLEIAGQNLKVMPRTYEAVLKQADQRLFNLRKRIEDIKGIPPSDAEVNAVLESGIQEELNIGVT